jgi:hypothetical protein
MTPTQADRDAASRAVWGEVGNRASDEFRDEITSGKRDDTAFVQAFTAHASAAREEALEQAARLCDGKLRLGKDQDDMCRLLATAIRALKLPASDEGGVSD